MPVVKPKPGAVGGSMTSTAAAAASPSHQLQQLPLASSLPKVSFRRIPEAEAAVLQEPTGLLDGTLNGYGFNTGQDCEQPEHYVRYIEPDEDELRKQVEYDMDEQDQAWLDALNGQRKSEGQDAISYESFEIIIDRFEKEWFDLMSRIPPKPRPGAGEEEDATGDDVKCAICDDGECENSNAIVFCDGCNLAVHQDCYGIPYIPEGQWLCRKCTVSPDRAVACMLCPHEGGAFKQTTNGKWAHLLCAMWIPETGVSNPVYMEPIDSVERIPKGRWSLKCYLCQRKMGACIQCTNRNCFTAFHVTCARQAGLLIKSSRERVGSHDPYHGAIEDEYAEALHAYCHRHMPDDVEVLGGDTVLKLYKKEEIDPLGRKGTPVIVPGREGRNDKAPKKAGGASNVTVRRSKDGKLSISISTSALNKKKISKSARAYKKSYRVGPPLVPQYILKRVLEYINRLGFRKKKETLHQIAKYWSLKREARRGAPLLKRLHLEPWTASSRPKELTEEDKMKKLTFVYRLRNDLEKLRMLAEMVHKRELQKLKQAKLIREVLVGEVLRPFHEDMVHVLDDIQRYDRQGLFLHLVDAAEVPDYYDVVKKPMTWTIIRDKLDGLQYTTVDDFADDINLVASNAMLYNKPETSFWQLASRIKKRAEELLAPVRAKIANAHNHTAFGVSQEEYQSLDEESRSALDREVQFFALEPEQAAIEALADYGDEDLLASIGPDEDPSKAPANFVDDFARLYAMYDPPPAAQRSSRAGKQKKKARTSSSTTEIRRQAALLGIERKKARLAELEAAKAKKAEEQGASSEPSTMETPRVRERRTRNSTPKPYELLPMRETRKRKSEQAGGLEPSSEEAVPAKEAPRKRARSDSARSKPTSEKDMSGVPALLKAGDIKENTFFKQFETGWILPEGSKRGNRTQPPPALVPRRSQPPKKPTSQPRSRTSSSAGASNAAPKSATSRRTSSRRKGSEEEEETTDNKDALPASNEEAESEEKGPGPEEATSEISALEESEHEKVAEGCAPGEGVEEKADTESSLSDEPEESDGEDEDETEDEASSSAPAQRATRSAAGREAALKQMKEQQALSTRERREKATVDAEMIQDLQNNKRKTRGRGSSATSKNGPHPSHTLERSARGRFMSSNKVTEPEASNNNAKEPEPTEADQSAPVEDESKADTVDEVQKPKYKTWRDVWSKTEVPTGKMLTPGTLVWARTTGFSPYPGDVASAKEDRVPEALKSCEKNGKYAVQFFEGPNQTRRWCAEPASNLRLLGVDEEADEVLQRPPREAAKVQASYRQALRSRRR